MRVGAVLQTHDSRFEKLFEQYDDDQIGALDEHEDEAAGNADIGKHTCPNSARGGRHTSRAVAPLSLPGGRPLGLIPLAAAATAAF